MSFQFLPSLGEERGRTTPSCYCWQGKVRICLNCVAGVKMGKRLEGSGRVEGWVIWYHGISRGLNWNRQTASILCKETIIPWWNYSGYGKLVGVWGKTIFRNITTEIFRQSGCQESPRGRTCDSTSATPIKSHFTSNDTRSVSLDRRPLMTKHIRKCSEKNRKCQINFLSEDSICLQHLLYDLFVSFMLYFLEKYQGVVSPFICYLLNFPG